MRKTSTIVSITAALSLAASFPLHAQPRMSAEMNQVLQAYLLEDCGVGESDPAASLKAVVAFGRAAGPFLLRAVADGPPPKLMSDLEMDARADFKARRRFLEREGGLSRLEEQDVRDLALKQTEAEYVKMRVQSFDALYRQSALNAITTIGLEGVADDLSAIAEKTEDPDFREWIEEAVEKLN